MKILQLHSAYTSSKISGENSTVDTLSEIFSRFATSSLYKLSTDKLHNNLPAKMTATKKYLLLDRHLIDISSSFDFVILHNPIPLISAETLRSISKSSHVIRIWHNYRNSCISGNHFRNGHQCFDCMTRISGRFTGVFHKCYRESAVQSSIVSFAESRLRNLYHEKKIWHIGVSEFMCTHIRSLGIENSHIRHIPNSVTNMSFSESPRGDDVLMMGRIEPEKGFLQVIEAWNSIPMHVKGGRTLHIVGEGSMLDTVKLSSRKKDINLHGILTAAQISDLGAYCGTGIACSLWDEPFGKIAAEYQAMGLKTLVTPRGGLIEIAKKSPGGSVTRDINVESITNSLIEVLNNNLISRRQIFDSYESNYSVDSVTDKWKQFFEEILYG